MSKKKFNAFANSFVSKYLNIIVQLISMMVLARLLTPEDYGLYSITFIFTLFASLLKEFGVAGYIIKEEVITKEKLASCFSLMLMAGTLSAVTLYFFATPIAEFYEREKLIPMLQLLALNVGLSPFGTIVDSVLRRKMEFFPLTLCSLASSILSSAVMIYLAFSGYGAMSLVYGALAQTISYIVLIQAFRPSIVPRTPSLKYFGDVFHYSKYSGTSNIFGQLGNYSSELIVGKLYTMEILGFLSKANSVVTMFNKLFFDAMAQVISPLIASTKRSNNREVIRSIKTITNVQLNFAWPFFMLLGLLSDPVIYILLGEQWLEITDLLIILCISRLGYSIFQHINPILMGLGLAKSVMRIEVTSNISRIAVLLSTAQFGVEVMLISVACVNTLLRFSMYIPLIRNELQLPFSTYFSWLIKPFICALLSVSPVVAVRVFTQEWQSNIVLYVTAIFLSAIIWLILLRWQPASIVVRSIVQNVIKKAS
ncbi:hypothetical protein RJ44_04555 [Alteromonas macleodii]|uniref:oligosaccharide flippase family protein n=1 Tax=Alteromonas macleodii TaxID=28108 RepID=UPI00057EB160|nr:oligosaccharide flippase family protein [Alteromonas macleodii]KHT60315.1 hypothetical protein RJ44_04555 [Alteromonas macleodii]